MIRKAMMGGTVFAALLAVSASVSAVSTSLWEQRGKGAFEAGEPHDVSIIAPGKIQLGPKAQTHNLNARYSWALVEDSAGTLYAGTGSGGAVFRIDAKGEAAVFAELDMQQVFTLVIDKNDIIYAGGFPGGKIYSINPKGEVGEFYNTQQASIWALCLGHDGNVYAATGDDGKIFQVHPDGSGKILYDSRERRLLSLIVDEEGNLYAGSDQNGIIYKFNREGAVSVFYDTEQEEVTAMVMGADKSLYAVSAPGNLFMRVSPPQSAPIIPKAAGAMEDGGMAAEGQGGNNGQPAAPLPGFPAIPTSKKRTCIIYKIEKSGAATKLWTSPEQLIFSLAIAGEYVLAGSGDDGIIYMISPGGEGGTFYKADQKQVLALHQSGDGSITAGLGNDAAVVSFAGVYSGTGTYFSQVHDATAVSKWGRVFWEADIPSGARVLVSTRSGNNEKPDDTWSEWDPAGGSAKGFVSASPDARYIQWRAHLETTDPYETPQLRKMTIAYLQNNLPPKVQTITVGEPGAAGKEQAAAAPNFAAALKAMAAGAACPPGQEDDSKANGEGVKTIPAAHNSKIKIQWQALDENDDKLQYELRFRGADEQNWKLLKKDLTESSHEWNTESVPDGDYQVMVIASDKLNNPAGTALEADRISDLFTIDNTAPQVKVLDAQKTGKTQRYRIISVVSDKTSPVSTAHYSIDAGEWIPVFPEDGIFDSPSEKVRFETEELEKGEHTVVLKVVDYFGNIGAGKISFVAQ